MRLSDEDINFVEHFVRTELLQVLQDKCSKHSALFDENDLQNFFGLYDSNTSNFKILLGDRKLLKAAAERVNEIHTTQSFVDFLARFTTPPNYTISKSNTDKLSVGTFFGKKVRAKVAKSIDVPCAAENLSTQVLTKVRAIIDSFISKGLKSSIGSVPNDIVKIVNYGTGIRADVICVFCISVDDEGNINDMPRKVIAVPYESRGTLTGYWNYGNLKKHFGRHTLKSTGIKPESSDEFEINGSIVQHKTPQKPKNESSQPSNAKTFERIPGESDASTAQNSSPQKRLYDKFAAQNLNVMETMMLNGELTVAMSFSPSNPNETVQTIPIAPDGNCIFAATVHQLYNVKAGSEDHVKLTTELRSKVVKHILENLTRYVRLIRFRLVEENYCDAAVAEDADDDVCKGFILNYIAKPGNWGGTETLMAICELFSANILIFKKNDSFYYATGFNETYDRILFLAYSNGNHYDSVCEISESVMYKCVSRTMEIDIDLFRNSKRVISV